MRFIFCVDNKHPSMPYIFTLLVGLLLSLGIFKEISICTYVQKRLHVRVGRSVKTQLSYERDL
jgi:hypothetical protein